MIIEQINSFAPIECQFGENIRIKSKIHCVIIFANCFNTKNILYVSFSDEKNACKKLVNYFNT